MAGKPDVPCIRCGQLTWSTWGSSPPERRVCQPCRRIEPQPSQIPRPKSPKGPCLTCGGPITGQGKIYCSLQCCKPQAPRQPRQWRPCEICGKQFKPRREGPTCSRACGVEYRRRHGTYAQAVKPAVKRPAVKRREPAYVTVLRKADAKKRDDEWLRFVRQMYRPTRTRPARPRRVSVTRFIPYLIMRDHGKCQIAKCMFADRRIRAKTGPGRPSADHIIPWSLWRPEDGPDPDCLENLQLAHLRCNVSKGNRQAGQPLLFG